MDDKLISTINKIVRLCKENPEFEIALKMKLNIATPSNTSSANDAILEHISAIRQYLGIRANCSISYDFICAKNHQNLRNQLIVDNLKMENASLNLQIQDESERFYVFCVNAFYQIENIVNYYFHSKYPNIEDLVTHIKESTEIEGDYAFNPDNKMKYKTIADIDMIHKLNAIGNSLFAHKKTNKIVYSYLRRVRNEGAHRCMTILSNNDEANSLYKFFKMNTFNSVRALLIELVNTIKQELSDLNKQIIKEGIIKSCLPGACFIEIEGNTIQVDINKFAKIAHKEKGTKLKVIYNKNHIINITEIDTK